MTRFRYVAADGRGAVAEGVLEGADASDAVLRLSRRGLFAIEVAPATGLGSGLAPERDATARAPATPAPSPLESWRAWLPGAQRVRGRDVTALTRALATFLGAGFPLASALAYVRDHTPRPGLRALIAQVHAAIRDGAKLSAALAAHPAHFPPAYTAMVLAGEESGRLALAFERLALTRERAEELRAEVVGALLYPGIMALAMLGSVAVLLSVVVPRFARMFADMGGALPLPTRVLLAVSGAVEAGFWALPLVALIGGGLALAIRRNPRGRMAFERAWRRLPLAGPLSVAGTTARLSRVLATLLESGVVLLRALECARGVSGSEVADAAIERSIAGIRDGRSLAETLRGGDAFPDDFVAMVRLGEESSRLPELLGRAAEAGERDVLILVRALVKLLEPLMILCMGLLVGGIVAAMMLPIFDMNLLVK